MGRTRSGCRWLDNTPCIDELDLESWDVPKTRAAAELHTTSLKTHAFCAPLPHLGLVFCPSCMNPSQHLPAPKDSCTDTTRFDLGGKTRACMCRACHPMLGMQLHHSWNMISRKLYLLRTGVVATRRNVGTRRSAVVRPRWCRTIRLHPDAFGKDSVLSQNLAVLQMLTKD